MSSDRTFGLLYIAINYILGILHYHAFYIKGWLWSIVSVIIDNHIKLFSECINGKIKLLVAVLDVTY